MRSWTCVELLGLMAACLAGCSSNTPTTTAIVRPTLIAIVPSEVFPMLPCSDSPGGFNGYVGFLRDVTPGFTPDGGAAIELPSSAGNGATPCDRTTTFSYVGVGHYYVADVDGYDRSDLHAPSGELDGSTVGVNGSRVLLDPSGQPVAPRWSARCGYTLGGFDQPDSGLDGGKLDGGAPASAMVDAGAKCLAQDFQPPGVLAISTLTRHAIDCIDAVSLQLDALSWSCGGVDGIAGYTIDTPDGTAPDGGTAFINSCRELGCSERAVLQVQSLEQIAADTDAGEPARVQFSVTALSASGAVLKQATCTPTWSRGLIQPVESADCIESPVP